MCITALPDHLNSQEEIDAAFPDDSQYSGLFGKAYRWFHKHTKGMTAFGPRDIHWLHRWRDLPIVLVAWFGPGDSRWEHSKIPLNIRAVNAPIFLFNPAHASDGFYLSRVQYWTDWSVSIQWPLVLYFHFRVKGQVWMGYIGAKRDSDCYWFPSIFFGRGFK